MPVGAAHPGRKGKMDLVETDKLIPEVQGMYDKGYLLEDLAVVDMAEGFLVVYHFLDWETSKRVTIRVVVSHEEPRLPSITSIYQGAEWSEREGMEMYGVVFEGNPNPAPLLLDESMIGLYPLRKKEEERKPLNTFFPEES